MREKNAQTIYMWSRTSYREKAGQQQKRVVEVEAFTWKPSVCYHKELLDKQLLKYVIIPEVRPKFFLFMQFFMQFMYAIFPYFY